MVRQPVTHELTNTYSLIYVIKLEIILVACGEEEAEEWGGQVNHLTVASPINWQRL